MKIKIIAFLTALLMLFATGCAEKTPVTSNKKGVVQYVLAMNPSVILADGTVEAIRNNVAKSISTDAKSENNPSLYENSSWQWIYADSGAWNQRLIREVSLWKNSSGNSKSGVPYAYTVTDNGSSSIAAFDKSKMDIKGLADAELPNSGILMSFTGDKEEALIYTAKSDSTVTFSDFAGGNITAVGSIAGVDTSFTASNNPIRNVLLRIYRNNRIYWQEVINGSNPTVKFPEFSGIELKAGDSLIISAKAMATEELQGIKTGNCDLPATEKTVLKDEYHTEQVLVGYTDPYAEEKKFLSLVNDYGEATFKITRPEKTTKTVASMIGDFRSKVSKTLGVDVEYGNDSFTSAPADYEILVYNTKYDESKAVLSEIEKTRTANAGDFIIKMVGNKLVIAANNEFSLQFALDFFIDNYCKDQDAKIHKELSYISSNFNPVKDVKLGGVSVADYTVVYSHCASFIETSAAKHLVQEIVRTTGHILEMVNDNATVKKHEILIGDTNRKNYRNLANYTQIAHNSVDDKYKIEITDKYVSVLGGQIYGVNAGAIKLANLIKEGKTDFKVGYNYSDKYDGDYTLTDGYKLAFADEFNGDKLSKTWVSKAQVEEEDNDYGGKTYLSRSNSYVKDGALIQVARKDGNDTYKAGLFSDGSNALRFQWGYIEIRVKFSKTPGVCASFWTQASVTGGFLESDIYETFGNPFNIKHNLHTWETGKHQNLLGGTGSILNTAAGTSKALEYGYEYHTVGWEWTDDRSNFYVDGVLTETFDSSSSNYDVFDKPAWIILSTHLGGGGYNGDNALPADFTSSFTSYDWMHIYQKDIDGTVLYQKNVK